MQPQQQPYAPASSPSRGPIAHPRSATMPTMGSPGPAGNQTYGVNSPYNENSGLTHSQSVTGPAGHVSVDMRQVQTSTLQHMIQTPQQTPQQTPMPTGTYYPGAGGSPVAHAPLHPQATGSSAIVGQFTGSNMQPGYSPNVQTPAAQNNYPTALPSNQQTSYVPPPQPNAPSELPPIPYQNEQERALPTQPLFEKKPNGGIVSCDPSLNTDGELTWPSMTQIACLLNLGIYN